MDTFPAVDRGRKHWFEKDEYLKYNILLSKNIATKLSRCFDIVLKICSHNNFKFIYAIHLL